MAKWASGQRPTAIVQTARMFAPSARRAGSPSPFARFLCMEWTDLPGDAQILVDEAFQHGHAALPAVALVPRPVEPLPVPGELADPLPGRFLVGDELLLEVVPGCFREEVDTSSCSTVNLSVVLEGMGFGLCQAIGSGRSTPAVIAAPNRPGIMVRHLPA